jgi:hypothetical protein
LRAALVIRGFSIRSFDYSLTQKYYFGPKMLDFNICGFEIFEKHNPANIVERCILFLKDKFYYEVD